MVRHDKINARKLMIIVYKNLKALIKDSDGVSYTILQLRKEEFYQEKSREILKEFERIKNSWSTTIVQPDNRYSEKRESGANERVFKPGSNRNYYQTRVTENL